MNDLAQTETLPGGAEMGTALPTTVRWVLTGGEFPSISAALSVGERFQDAVMGTVKAALGEQLPRALECHEDGGVPKDHLHPFYLAEDADGDGRIDHLVLHAPRGLSPDWLWTLATLRPAGAPTGALKSFGVVADWVGRVEARSGAGGGPGTLLGPARHWCSLTPYLAPWHVKSRLQPLDQLGKELRLRELPEPTVVQAISALTINGRRLGPAAFQARRGTGAVAIARSGGVGTFWRITFPEPVAGPLALGFACHLGLGLFRREHGVLGDVGCSAAGDAIPETGRSPHNLAEMP